VSAFNPIRAGCRRAANAQLKARRRSANMGRRPGLAPARSRSCVNWPSARACSSGRTSRISFDSKELLKAAVPLSGLSGSKMANLRFRSWRGSRTIAPIYTSREVAPSSLTRRASIAAPGLKLRQKMSCCPKLSSSGSWPSTPRPLTLPLGLNDSKSRRNKRSSRVIVREDLPNVPFHDPRHVVVDGGGVRWRNGALIYLGPHFFQLLPQQLQIAVARHGAAVTH
jgi:hypothetical protein